MAQTNKMKLDLTASRWASPEVRRERDYQSRTRTPSPQRSFQQYRSPIINVSNNQTSTPPHSLGANPNKVGFQSQTTTRSLQQLSAAQRQYQTRLTDLNRFRRLFKRLRWKANSLTHWSHRALSITQQHALAQHENLHNHAYGIPNPLHQGPSASLGYYEFVVDPIDAERQFKIDFYEFYALLERGLVCLFGVWGIIISASQHDEDVVNNNMSSGIPSRSIIGNSRAFHGAEHRFHANILAALDQPASPLHEVLGMGDVREYIGVAKEFRNKWKDAEQRPDDSFHGSGRAEEELDASKIKRYERVLKDLQLEPLLGTILAGLEEAGRRAEVEIQRLGDILGGGIAGRDGIDQALRDGHDNLMDDAPFEVGGFDRMDYDMEM